MEREVSDIVNLGVTLITLAVVLSFVLVTVITGKHMAYNYLDKASVIKEDMESGDLKYLQTNETEMPTASLLAIVSSNEDYINQLYLDYADLYGATYHDRLYKDEGGKTNTYLVFSRNIKSKVKIYVEYNKDGNGYDIYVHDVNCSNPDLKHVGACTH